MDRALNRNPWELFQNLGSDSLEDDDRKLNRQVLVALATMTGAAGVLWGALYWYFGEPMAAAIPWIYSLLALVNLVAFSIFRRDSVFRFCQLALILLLPFFLMAALGGFVNASAVIIWSLLAPLAALLVSGRRQAGRWFLAYLALIVISGFMEINAPDQNNLPSLVLILFFVLNICIPTLCAFLLLVYFVSQKDTAMRLLNREQQKSDRLLLNVLPREIATLLKEDNSRNIAQYYNDVSVLFADIVGFTPLSETLSPQEAVDVLNEIFSHFDSLADQNGVEKIRTIGDGYMAASGVPIARSDHAQALARMALQMLAYMQSRPMEAGIPMEIRIGLNSGAAVAGIVGATKFHYDLWGDAVNVAARMESHGEPGKIQIGRGMFDLIGDEFTCNPRGWIPIKGKGEMETWFLTSECVAPAIAR